jgi:hypothetical protein
LHRATGFQSLKRGSADAGTGRQLFLGEAALEPPHGYASAQLSQYSIIRNQLIYAHRL